MSITKNNFIFKQYLKKVVFFIYFTLNNCYNCVRVLIYSLLSFKRKPLDQKEVSGMKYEIMYIVRPDLEEGKMKEVVSNFEKVLTDNKAKITFSKELGQKELAYEIKKFKHGYYYLYQIEASKEAIKEFDRLALLSEEIIRHMIIKLEE